MATAADICTDALREIGVLNAVDVASGEDAAFALGKLNRLLDNWNAERRAVYADTINTYTIVPATQPHTIGPAASSPTWTATQRPVSIAHANLVVGDVRYPLRPRDRDWWMALSDPELTGQPSDFWYEPDWPLGKVRLWPVPTAADEIELLSRVLLAALVLSDTFTMPPGYQDAVTLTLAEDLGPAFQVPVPLLTARNADKARVRIFGNNDRTPRLITRDFGMPGGTRSTFDYRTGR
jgi:hypothetical protein